MAGEERIKIKLFRNADNFRPYKAGDVIFKEGDPGEELFIIRNGRVDILVGDRVVTTLEQDEVFGEMAIVDKQPRSATAIAATDCELVPVDNRRFLFLIGQTPHFAIHIMQMLAARLRQMDATLHQK